MPKATKHTRRNVQVYQTFTPTKQDLEAIENKHKSEDLLKQLQAENKRSEDLLQRIQQANELLNQQLYAFREQLEKTMADNNAVSKEDLDRMEYYLQQEIRSVGIRMEHL